MHRGYLSSSLTLAKPWRLTFHQLPHERPVRCLLRHHVIVLVHHIPSKHVIHRTALHILPTDILLRLRRQPTALDPVHRVAAALVVLVVVAAALLALEAIARRP